MNTFMNTFGGEMMFGVDNKGFVRGLVSRNTDEVALACDNIISEMWPEPDMTKV